MAISGGDGSIILTTKVDTAGVTTGITKVKAAVTKAKTSLMGIGTTISKGFKTAFTTLSAKLKALSPMIMKMIGYFALMFSVQKIRQFISESEELYKIQMQNEVKLATVMRERIGATDEQIQQMLDLAAAEQQVGIIADEVQLAGLQQVATFVKQQDTLETLLPAMNNLIAQQYGYEASTESARNVANLMGKALQGQTGALTRVGITFNETQEQVLKYGNESERAAVLAEVITDNVGEMNKALASTDVGRQRQLANTMGDIKEQFGAAFTQIAIVFLPVLQTLANVLAKVAVIARTAAQNIASAFGKSSDNASAQNQAIQSSVENQEALTDAVEDTAKAQKKNLTKFDEINILTENSASSQEDIADLTDTIGSGGLFSGGIQSVSGDIDAELATIMGYVGFALAAIGIILICFGHIGWGIGFLIAGATMFSVSQAALSEGAEAEKVKNIMNGIIAGISYLALVLGIILVCTGVGIPLGIGLIIVGAAGLATEVALNWNAIKETVVNVFNAVIDWIKTYGLLVLGIILCLTGTGIPFGIALIIKWAKDGAEKGVPLSTAIVDKVKEIWAAVKQFWNTYIAPIFTAKWWADLGKKAINGLLGVIESGLNWIIDKINEFVGGLSEIVGAVGDVIGVDWDIPKIPRVSIPRLAQGAVIPPNREFLAVLGDQKQGTNIEAPLQTIVDAFNIALQGNANYGGGNTEVVLEIDGREFGRAVVEQGNRENRRIGTRLVIV